MDTDKQGGKQLKVISPTIHSVIDYVIIAVLLVSPSVLELTGVFAYGAYGLAAAHFLLTITTRFAGGMFSVLSFRAHGVIELLIALGMVVSPWVFQFANQADPRNFFLTLGILLFALGFFTRYQPYQKERVYDDKQQSDDEVSDFQSDQQEGVDDNTDQQ